MAHKPKMNRVLVIGMPGGGKSTLSAELSRRLGLPLYHLDRLFWKPKWEQTPDNEFEKIQADLISRDRWIIDGSYTRTLGLRLTRADTVIHLDFARWLCLYRITKRVVTSYGKVRPDMGEDCPEHFDWEFYRWVWNYRRNHRPRIYDLLYEAQDRLNIVTLTKPSDVTLFLEQLAPAKSQAQSAKSKLIFKSAPSFTRRTPSRRKKRARA